MSNVTKVFFDMEFTGLVTGTTPISLAMIANTGDEFYAEFNGYDRYLVNDWIKENVLANLYFDENKDLGVYRMTLKDGAKAIHMISDYGDIVNELEEWLGQFEQVQLIGDTCFYDMVLLCNMFDGSFNLPKNVTPVPYDICQDICARHVTETGILYAMPDPDCMGAAFDISREDLYKAIYGDLPEGKQHNALYDARITKGLYEHYHTDMAFLL